MWRPNFDGPVRVVCCLVFTASHLPVVLQLLFSVLGSAKRSAGPDGGVPPGRPVLEQVVEDSSIRDVAVSPY